MEFSRARRSTNSIASSSSPRPSSPSPLPPSPIFTQRRSALNTSHSFSPGFGSSFSGHTGSLLLQRSNSLTFSTSSVVHSSENIYITNSNDAENSRKLRTYSTSDKIRQEYQKLYYDAIARMVLMLILISVLYTTLTFSSHSVDRIAFHANNIFVSFRGLLDMDFTSAFTELQLEELQTTTKLTTPRPRTNESDAESDLDAPDRQLPSLNLFDYDAALSYPIFDEYPDGLSRKDMPQLDFNRTTSFWDDFHRDITLQGGKFTLTKNLDLRIVKPLQREISGFIVYNILFGDDGENIRNKLDLETSSSVHNRTLGSVERRKYLSSDTLNWFSSHIILVKTPTAINARNSLGQSDIIEQGSYLILDGHHTTFVAANLCAMLPHSLLRLGEVEKSVCGDNFEVKQDVFVIEGLEVLKVRDIALRSGAITGHDLTVDDRS